MFFFFNFVSALKRNKCFNLFKIWPDRCDNWKARFIHYSYSNITSMTFIYLSLDINECKAGNPCKNRGTCINTIGSYKCACSIRFTGKHCELGKLYARLISKSLPDWCVTTYVIIYQQGAFLVGDQKNPPIPTTWAVYFNASRKALNFAM